MPPLLGRPEGQNEMAVDLKDLDLKPPARQNEMAVDLKDVDLNSRLQDKSPPVSGPPPHVNHLLRYCLPANGLQ